MPNKSISIRRGISWVGAAQIGKIGLQLVSVVTLARILPPSDYGLLAMAGIATALAALFRDFGTGAAAIQAKQLTTELRNSLFTFNLLVGVVLTGALCLLAPILAALFSEHRLSALVASLSPVFLISSAATVPQAVMERESRFKTLAKIELTSASLALSVAIVMALAGAGVYALVGQSLLSATVSMVLLRHICDAKLKLRIDIQALKSVASFSTNVLSFNLLNYFHRNGDSFLIGRFLGATELGIYNIAYRLLLFPLQNVTFVVSRASFPVYSRHQGDPAAVGRHYLETLRTICFITAPAMGVVWALREPLLVTILGPKWLASASVLAWLAPVGFFQSIVSTSGSVLNALDKSSILRNLGLIGTPMLVGSIAAGLPWGINGVAAAYCVVNFLWIFPVLNTVFRQVHCSLAAFFGNVYQPIIAAVCLALAFRFMAIWANGAGLHPAFVLVSGSLSFAACYLLVTRPWWPQLITSVFDRLTLRFPFFIC